MQRTASTKGLVVGRRASNAPLPQFTSDSGDTFEPRRDLSPSRLAVTRVYPPANANDNALGQGGSSSAPNIFSLPTGSPRTAPQPISSPRRINFGRGSDYDTSSNSSPSLRGAGRGSSGANSPRTQTPPAIAQNAQTTQTTQTTQTPVTAQTPATAQTQAPVAQATASAHDSGGSMRRHKPSFARTRANQVYQLQSELTIQSNQVLNFRERRKTLMAPDLPEQLALVKSAKAGAAQSTDYNQFLKDYPGYLTHPHVDTLREKEIPELDKQSHIYLDYTGAGLSGFTQRKRYFDFLNESILGNPHSVNPTSMKSTKLIHEAHQAIYKWFNCDPEEYTIIFTSNASGAIRQVAESYPFTHRSVYVLTYDNHNSINGMREYAKSKRAKVFYVPIGQDFEIDADILKYHLNLKMINHRALDIAVDHKLFAYPAQSNLSGVQHSLEWVDYAQKLGWDVFLDIAAFVPTSGFDFSKCKPDYAGISFYKIFGFPTGLGCLIAKHEKIQKLIRPWFSGGTVAYVSCVADDYILSDADSGAFEDGTVNFSCIPAIKIGLDYVSDDIGMANIKSRIKALNCYLWYEMEHLRHSNGAPVVKMYGTTDPNRRGGNTAFNMLTPEGEIIPRFFIEEFAAIHKISLRTGCFCNPGPSEVAHGLTREIIYKRLHDKENFRDFLISIGMVRISMGPFTNFKDIWILVQFLKLFKDKVPTLNDTATFT